MSWWPDLNSIKRKACGYILRRYGGPWLKEKEINLDQLSIDLFNGKASFSHFDLDINQINESFSEFGIPLEVIDCYVGEVSANVPWSSIFNDNSILEVKKFELSLSPVHRENSNVSLFDSMLFSSMTTSMQLAEECLREDDADLKIPQDLPYEGVHNLACTVEAIFTKVKVNFLDTTVCLEYYDKKESSSGVLLEMKIDKIEYFDEDALAPASYSNKSNSNENSTSDKQKLYEAASIKIKNLHFYGIKIFISELKNQSIKQGSNHVNICLENLKSSDVITKQPSLNNCNSHSSGHSFNNDTSYPVSDDFNTKIINSNNLTEDLLIKKIDEINVDAEGSILFFSFSGRQEFKLKLKQNMELPGPKRELDGQISTFNIFLTPKLLGLLIKVAKGFLDLPDKGKGNKQVNKKMMAEDYEKIKLGLEYAHKSINSIHAFRPQTFDESDEDNDIFLSMAAGRENHHFRSMNSSYSSDVTNHESNISDSSSTIFTKKATSKCNMKKTRHFGSESTENNVADICQIKVKCSFLSIILLHNDVIEKTEASTLCLEETSKLYFDNIKSIPLSGVTSIKDLIFVRNKYSQAISINHFCLLCKPLTLEINEFSNSFTEKSTTNVLVGLMDFVEAIFTNNSTNLSLLDLPFPISDSQPDYCQLLVFKESANINERNNIFHSMIVPTPCFKLEICSSSKLSNKRIENGGKTFKFSFNCNECTSELDITIVDRLHSLIPLFSFDSSQNLNGLEHQSIHTLFNETIEDDIGGSNTHIQLDISLKQLSLNIRFPIVDLSAQRSLPNGRILHEDILCLRTNQFNLKSNIETHTSLKANTVIEITFKNLIGDFQMKGDIGQTFIKIQSDIYPNDIESGFNWPRCVITMFAEKSCELDSPSGEEESSGIMMPESIIDQFPIIKNNQKVPFSSRNFLYDNNQLVIPCNRNEMHDFQDSLQANVDFLIELSLCHFDVFIPTKPFLEVLYNRFLNDLLLWQPLILGSKTIEMNQIPCGTVWSPQFVSNLINSRMNLNDYESINHDINSMSDSEDEHGKNTSTTNVIHNLQSRFCFSININSARIIASLNAQNDEWKSIGNAGEVMLELGDLQILIVEAFEGDPEHQIISLQLLNATLYHLKENADFVKNESMNMEMIFEKIKDDRTCIIFHSDNITSLFPIPHSPDILALSMSIRSESFRNIKDYKISIGLSQATLQYCIEEYDWAIQFLSLFNLVDYPIVGYQMPTIITELHVNLWGCAVEYRPMNLPLRVLITFDMLYLESNIIQDATASIFRILLDDAALYLSTDTSIKRLNYEKDYISVIDIGTFELCLRTSDKQNSRCLKTDLKASCNIVNIRTCSDSFKLLSELIIYLASSGDKAEHQNYQSSKLNVPINGDLEESTDEPHLKENAFNDFNDDLVPVQMAEAMDDVDNIRTKSTITASKSVNIAWHGSSISNNHRSKISNSMLPSMRPNDEEFFIIQREAGLGFRPSDGEPIIRTLTTETITIVDDYFKKALTKTDLLQCPSCLPNSLHRYSISQVTIVWYLYGGKDFSTNNDKKSNLNDKTNFKQNWKHRGGQMRDSNTLMELQLTKVRMQCDIFEKDAPESSRVALIITDVEIRDRIHVSDINKFLFQYSCESMPKQTHANMVVVKLLQVRSDLQSEDNEEECLLKISIQPIRLNIDQDALLFLNKFFVEVSSDMGNTISATPCISTVRHISEQNEEIISDSNFQSENFNYSHIQNEQTKQLYFRSVKFSPDVLIKIDYRGKRVDLEHGTLVGLISGLAHLNSSEIRLKSFHNRHGLLGVDKVFLFAFTEWRTDIINNQLPGIISGVGPINSFVQLGNGLKDLFWLPVEQYRRDGRFMRGLQRGGHSFATSTAVSALELTNRLVDIVQSLAEAAHDIVSPSTHAKLRKRRVRGIQFPADLRQGVEMACNALTEGVYGKASDICTVVRHEHEEKGVVGVIGGVLRQIPSTIIEPVIIGMEATSNLLGGMRNQLIPERRKEDEDKWKQEGIT